VGWSSDMVHSATLGTAGSRWSECFTRFESGPNFAQQQPYVPGVPRTVVPSAKALEEIKCRPQFVQVEAFHLMLTPRIFDQREELASVGTTVCGHFSAVIRQGECLRGRGVTPTPPSGYRVRRQ
jgi:hypothetical protein